ncbi:hypothetical protein FRC09_019800 [Ceratobasidium sp. 395]|nr:hypothetical protein FRC09_019800 [Ceratobasidium sp. 395]
MPATSHYESLRPLTTSRWHASANRLTSVDAAMWRPISWALNLAHRQQDDELTSYGVLWLVSGTASSFHDLSSENIAPLAPLFSEEGLSYALLCGDPYLAPQRAHLESLASSPNLIVGPLVLLRV